MHIFPAPTVPTSTPSNCQVDKDFIPLMGSTYYINIDSNANYEDSEAACLAKNAVLPIARDEMEYTILNRLHSRSFTIINCQCAPFMEKNL